jgi:hypothetical protein
MAVEKVGFSEISRKSGDRKCPGDWGKSLADLLKRNSFCEIEVSEFFNSYRIYQHLSEVKCLAHLESQARRASGPPYTSLDGLGFPAEQSGPCEHYFEGVVGEPDRAGESPAVLANHGDRVAGCKRPRTTR